MDIPTVKEASFIWGISVRRINDLCKQDRILGAQKIAGVWLLPKDAKNLQMPELNRENIQGGEINQI